MYHSGMAHVYLPLGYPLLNETFENVVYQGNVARFYNIPKDPRTDSQIFNRNLLGDVVKMRGCAGTWAKGLWKIAFGKRWATIIYQMVRGDVDGNWSAGIDSWKALSDEQKAVVSGEAPFKVTFNDPGMVWWGLYGMLYRWADVHGMTWWQMPPVIYAGWEEMKAWWMDLKEQAGNWGGIVSTITVGEGEIFLIGTWNIESDVNAQGGEYAETSEGGAKVQFVALGRWLTIYYKMAVDQWVIRRFVDGVDQGDLVNLRNGITLWQQSYKWNIGSYGLHLIELVFDNGGNPIYKGNFDAAKVARLESE